jgi:hypothetical protein
VNKTVTVVQLRKFAEQFEQCRLKNKTAEPLKKNSAAEKHRLNLLI